MEFSRIQRDRSNLVEESPPAHTEDHVLRHVALVMNRTFLA
jgi:hypothetical protein